MLSPSFTCLPSRRQIVLHTLACAAFALMGPALQGQEAAATSSLREVGGLKLNCPLPLEEKSKTGENEMMHSQAQYSVKTDGYEVAVVSIHYKDSVPLDLQKISQGSASSMSKLEGVTNPKTEFKSLTLAGADEARLMSFKADRFGKVLRTESTYIRKGQQLWMAIVTFTEDDKRSIFVGETISKSVRLQ